MITSTPCKLPALRGRWFPAWSKLSLLCFAAGTLAVPALAQSSTGMIEGRVFNTRSGEFLNQARIRIEGTALETFSDSFGHYRLTNVPAGPVRITAFFTGLAAKTEALTVAAGTTVPYDFNLAGFEKPSPSATETIVLAEFTVTESRAMDGAAIAINEQRFAANMKNVLSTDEFGDIPDGNIGEFIKFMPGVTVTGNGGDMRYISLNGAPAQYVPITLAGFDLASAQSSGTARTVELEQLSVNNLARIEVNYSPTPESPGSALAGSVNLVPRSAFERARPEITASAYLMMRDSDKSLRKTPGPQTKDTYKVRPGFDVTAIVPVNKRFGFTISAANSTQFTPQDGMQNTWRGPDAGTNGGSLPDTTPDKPYLTDYQITGTTKFTYRSSGSATLDYRLSQTDRLSFSFQYAYFNSIFVNRSLTFFVNRVAPTDFSLSYTHGAVGAGEVQIGQNGRDKAGTTYMPTLVYRHDGPIWKAEVGLGLSEASNHYRDIDKGYVLGANARRTGVTVNFDDIWYLRPGRITVADGATGAPVDPYNLGSYSLTSVTAGPIDSSDTKRSAYANLRRDFAGWVPLSLKAGLDVRQAERDIRQGGLGSFSLNYLGADGRTSTTPVNNDDVASFAVDPSSSRRSLPFGFPATQWLNPNTLWSLYQTSPQLFSAPDENSRYRTFVGNSKHAEEIVAAAFLRADVQLFNNRLKLVGGVRAEQTNVKAEGPLTDPTRNYQHDASGAVIPQRDANGNILRNANGTPVPALVIPTSNALGVSQLTYRDRAMHANKEYLRWFPSLNASFNVRPNLIARAAYYYSVGRPDYNQYAGGITLPDLEQPPSQTTNRIVVNNVGIKAWSAHSTKVALEYYFERVGLISVGAFRRDIYNFFGSQTFAATPEFLALYDLEPTLYGKYYTLTQYNLPYGIRLEGLDVNYKQALTFLPNWARGVQVFANASAQHVSNDSANAFLGFIPRTYNWGVSLTRPKFNLKANWNYKSRGRRMFLSYRSSDPDNYSWVTKQLYIDVTGEYYLTRNIALYANLRNLNDAFEENKIFGSSTPDVATFRYRNDYGAVWTFGVRGRF